MGRLVSQKSGVAVERVPEAEQGIPASSQTFNWPAARLWVAHWVHAGEHDYPAYPGQVSLECVPLSEPPHPRPRPRQVAMSALAKVSNSSPQGHCSCHCQWHDEYATSFTKVVAKNISKVSAIASMSFPHQSAGGKKGPRWCALRLLRRSGTSVASRR